MTRPPFKPGRYGRVMLYGLKAEGAWIDLQVLPANMGITLTVEELRETAHLFNQFAEQIDSYAKSPVGLNERNIVVNVSDGDTDQLCKLAKNGVEAGISLHNSLSGKIAPFTAEQITTLEMIIQSVIQRNQRE